MGEIRKRLTAPAALILLALCVSVILVPVAASASNEEDHQQTGIGQSSSSSTTESVPVPTGGTGDHDGDADLDPVTTIEDSHEEEVGVADNQHPSGKDRSEEPGGSGNQGKSESAPDDNVGPMRNECGASPASDPRGGCTDKPGGSGGMDLHDQDGNNGCGNDDDFDDDNNGHCGKVKATPKPCECKPTPAPCECKPTPAPCECKPTPPPSCTCTPPPTVCTCTPPPTVCTCTPPPQVCDCTPPPTVCTCTPPPTVCECAVDPREPVPETFRPDVVIPDTDEPGKTRVKRRFVVRQEEEPPVRLSFRQPGPPPDPPRLPFTGSAETMALVMFGFALLLLGGGMVQLVSVKPTL